MEVLGVVLLLRNQLELLLFPGLDAQLQVFQSMLDTGQGRLDALSLVEVHDGEHTLGMYSRNKIYSHLISKVPYHTHF